MDGRLVPLLGVDTVPAAWSSAHARPVPGLHEAGARIPFGCLMAGYVHYTWAGAPPCPIDDTAAYAPLMRETLTSANAQRTGANGFPRR